MFSHVFFSVSDFDRALAFYDAVMDGLGLERRFCEPAKPWAGWHSAGRARPRQRRSPARSTAAHRHAP